MPMTPDEYARKSVEAVRALSPNPDGTRGFFLTPQQGEFWDWVDFFERNRMGFRASYYRKQGEGQGAYFPALSPMDLDAGYVPRLQARAKPAPRVISPEDRARLADQLRASVQTPARGGPRYRGEDPRNGATRAPVVEPRPLTPAEAASMRKLMGVPEPVPADDEGLSYDAIG